MKDIKGLKAEIATLIGDFDSRKSKAHITIRPEEPRSGRQFPNYLKDMERVLRQLPPIQLRTNGFEAFPNNGMIFVKFDLDDYIKRWFELLNEYLSVRSRIMPHITLAKGLLSDDFINAWSMLKGREYQREFVINHLLILERDVETSQFKPLKKIYFCNPDKELRPAADLFSAMPGLLPSASPTIFS
ncbi:hypothetical protein GCM10028827_29200 [Mucilaginibacter myungsuensis]